jgi:hypothetical protein
MIQRASFAGELALRVLARGGVAKVTRVFPGAVYARSRDDFVLLLWGSLKSPMTINLLGGRGASTPFGAEDSLVLDKEGLKSSVAEISVSRAVVHRGSLGVKRALRLPPGRVLAKGVSMLRSMYDVSVSGPLLADDASFRLFLKEVLIPYSKKRKSGLFRFGSYDRLIGRGTGFTPAGDDFVSGLSATFNFVARSRGSERINLPKRLLLQRTVPESGAMVAYSALGYVDEGMERLILASLGMAEEFHDELLSVASRGHTSGVDMALGVLLCEAALADRERRDGTMETCIATL